VKQEGSNEAPESLPEFDRAKNENQTGKDSDHPDSENRESGDHDRELMPPPSIPISKLKSDVPVSEKQIRKPLAAMLPEKYKGVDVRTVFPEFRPGQVSHSQHFISFASYKWAQ
jgi:hypothetical protein